jgi:hypothetical protein
MRRVLMKPALALLIAAALLVIAGCGATAPSHSSSPSPTPPSVAFTVPTKTFSSPQLGIAFRYPASWRLMSADFGSTFATYGIANLAVHSLRGAQTQGAVELMVESGRIYQQKPALPYMSVGPTAARVARKFQKAAKQPKLPVERFGLVTVGGLRLLSAEHAGGAPAPFWGSGQWRERRLYSRDSTAPQYPTMVEITVTAPKGQWLAAQATLDAILASMRFSTPQMTWSSPAPLPSAP